MQEFLAPLRLPSITSSQLESLAQPFSCQEILQTIKDFPSHKAPGPDGFINEFYKTYAEQIIPHLCNTFNRLLSTDKIPSESLEAVITTIHKTGKPSHGPANYRPMSLLNPDLKLYTKLLATRLTAHMPNQVHPDQVGFIPSQ